MKILFKHFVCFLFLFHIFTNCSLSNKHIQKEGEIFCILGISYFKDLLKDIEYVLHRSSDGYMFDLSNNYRIFVVIQPNNQFLYKEIFPVRDTIFNDIDVKNEYFSQRYSIEINKIKEIIHFCSKEKVSEIRNRENDGYYSFHTLSNEIIYKEVAPTFYFDKKICENWYSINQ